MIEIPEGSFESHGLILTSYLTPEGQSAYTVETLGDAPMTSYLGLLVVAQQEVLKWGDEDE